MAISTRPRAEAASFAHLAGLGRNRAAAEDETEEEKRDREERERDEDMRRMEDNGEDTGESEEDRDKRHDREEGRRGGRRARSEGDDDDGDDNSDREDMRGNSLTSRAYRRGIARCAAIFASPAAGRNPILAANLAFRGDLTRSEAIRILRDTPAPQAASPYRPDRAAGNPNLGSGGSAHRGGQAHTGQMWDAAIARVTGRSVASR